MKADETLEEMGRENGTYEQQTGKWGRSDDPQVVLPPASIRRLPYFLP